MIDIDKLYERLKDAALEVFGDFNINLDEMEPDDSGRGGNPDDIVYAISHKGIDEDTGEWAARKLLWCIRALKIYTEEYCQIKGIEVPGMYIRNDGNKLCIVKKDSPVYIGDIRDIDMLFVLTTFSKGKIEGVIEEIVPKFLSCPVDLEKLGESLRVRDVMYEDSGNIVIGWRQKKHD